MSSPPARALLIQTAFLGDVVLTTPLLAALARRHGPVDVVTTPIAAPLLETHPAVRRVISYDKRRQDRGWNGLRTLAGRLGTEGYGTAYLPHRSLRTAVLPLLARIPSRIGFSGNWSFLYTEKRPKPPTGPESDRLLALAGESPAAYAPSLDVTPEDEREAAQLLKEGGLAEGAAFVALAPGSIWGSKRWPYFPDLARLLAAKGVPAAVVGGPDDVELGASIGAAVNACGKLSLRQSAALIAKAALLVTNDSAPLHLATAMGTPIVALFGPTIPEFGFGPMRSDDVALGLDALPCRPCSRHGPPACPLGHHRCMRGLEPEAVLAAIEEMGALRRRN